VLGARMIEGIDFLEPARSGIRHQGERFDGRGTPDGLSGQAIPVVARVLAVVTAFEDLVGRAGHEPPTGGGVVGALSRDDGRFDPTVLSALRAALDKHGPAAAVIVAGERT
jgi:response regulator RpfG family c-di-GMP phosphodiesterase